MGKVWQTIKEKVKHAPTWPGRFRGWVRGGGLRSFYRSQSARIHNHWPALAILCVFLLVGMSAVVVFMAFRPGVSLAGAQSIYTPPSGRAPTGAFDGISAGLLDTFGQTWFVSLSGDDENSGRTIETAKRTISSTVAAAASGDLILVGPGLFAEDNSGGPGVLIDKSLTIRGSGSLRTLIENTAGGAGSSVVEVKATYVEIENLSLYNFTFAPVETVGLRVTGPGASTFIFRDVVVPSNPITNHVGIWLDTVSAASFLGGIEVSGAVFEPGALGVGTGMIISNSTNIDLNGIGFTGFYTSMQLIGANTANVQVQPSVSFFNCRVGYVIGLGVSNTSMRGSSLCNRTRVDRSGNPTNIRPREEEIDVTFRHQNIWPEADGEGNEADPIQLSSAMVDEVGTDTDEGYWGNVKPIVPFGAIDITQHSLGVQVEPETTATGFRGQTLTAFPSRCVFGEDVTGGSWTQGTRFVTMTLNGWDTEVGDGVMISSTTTVTEDGNVEIMFVTAITGSLFEIDSEQRVSARTGLRWNHGANPRMCTVDRPTAGINPLWWSTARVKAQVTELWPFPPLVEPGSWIGARCINQSNDLDGTVLYTHLWEAVGLQ